MDPQACPAEVSLAENPLEEHLIKTETQIEEDFMPESPQEDTLAEDPLAPTLRHQILNTQAKLMLLNVVRYFRKFRVARAKETGEDMNVNKVVAEATGVSMFAVKSLISEYRRGGIDWAIRPQKIKRMRKRKTDIVFEIKEDAPPKTTKKKQRKQ